MSHMMLPSNAGHDCCDPTAVSDVLEIWNGYLSALNTSCTSSSILPATALSANWGSMRRSRNDMMPWKSLPVGDASSFGVMRAG